MCPVVSELYIYPLKSGGEISRQSAHVDRFGLSQDRRWMIIDATGQFVTQRSHNELVFLGVALTDSGICLSWPDVDRLHVSTPFKEFATSIKAQVWDDHCDVLDAGDKPAAWLSKLLKHPVRLVFMPDDCRRIIHPKLAPNQETVSFADVFPHLLTSQSSLDDLNGRLNHAVEMLRFRPNIVVSNTLAFAENNWKRIRIGDVIFVMSRPCERCVITTIDRNTGNKGKEPLATLAKYRKINNKVIFGANLLHINEGTIRIGDEVEVLE